MTQWGLDALFNPSKRHMDEEKRRLQTTREQLGDSSGGKRIDLESGKVVIQRPARKADEADAPVEADGGPDAADGEDQAAEADAPDAAEAPEAPDSFRR
jgi:hypothetical protein